MDGIVVAKMYVSNGPTLEIIRQTLGNYDETQPNDHISQGLRENIESFEADDSSCNFVFWKDYERTTIYRGGISNYYRGSIHSVIKIIRDEENNRNIYFFFTGKDEAKSLSYRLSQILTVEMNQIGLGGRTILEIARADATRILMGWWKDLGQSISSIYLAGILMDDRGDNPLMEQIDRRADSISYIEYFSRTLEKRIGLSGRGVMLIRGGDMVNENLIDYYNTNVKNRLIFS